MATERVISKHLFHYQLDGVMDPTVEFMEQMMKEAPAQDPEIAELMRLHNSDDPDVDYLTVSPAFLRKIMGAVNENFDKGFAESYSKCDHTEFKVPPRDGNDYRVPVLVHTPNHLDSKELHPAIIFAHGGGVLAGDAAMFRGSLSHLALETNTVVFNVDFRNAPETQCPDNVLDFYCAANHIKENASGYGVDANKLAIAGESGGGYVCLATMVMLAQRNEGHRFKLAIPMIPMTSDYFFGDTGGMTKEERESAHGVRKTWKCIAKDFEKQRNDPLLFPGCASDEILRKVPPTIIWENEFDIFITEATRLAYRLRRAGRLLEFRVQPGMTHVSAWLPGSKGLEDNMRDWKEAIKEYLVGEINTTS